MLMRALRDFNIPKIVTDDVPVFMGLIGDLFPALDVPRKRDMDFEALVKKSALVRHVIHRSNYFQLGKQSLVLGKNCRVLGVNKTGEEGKECHSFSKNRKE